MQRSGPAWRGVLVGWLFGTWSADCMGGCLGS